MVAGLGCLHCVTQGFETRRLAGKVDPQHLLRVVQCLDLTVNRRQVQARCSGLRPRKDLLRAECLAAMRNCIDHGLALVGLALHGGILMQIDLH
jgi:hypothetical protein